MVRSAAALILGLLAAALGAQPTYARPTDAGPIDAGPDALAIETREPDRALQDLTFSRLRIADGQVEDTISAIAQDDRGFLWVGTQSGLARFDGYSFRTVAADPAPENNAITALLVDPRGALWAGTATGGLLQVDTLTERVERHRFEEDENLCFRSPGANQVSALLLDDAGQVWVGTQDGELIRFDPRTLDCQAFDLPRGAGGGGALQVSALAQDAQERIWVATFGGGLLVLDREGAILERKTHDPKDPGSLSSNLVHSLYVSAPGVLWSGTSDGVLHRLAAGTGSFERFYLEPANPIYAVVPAGDDTLWLATHGGGLALFDPGRGSAIQRYQRQATDPTSLAHNFLISLFEDRSGTLWIGTDSGGLLSCNSKRDRFRYHRVDLFDSNTLSHPTVWSLWQDPLQDGGDLWIGTSAGLDRYVRDNNTYEAIPLVADQEVVWAVTGSGDGVTSRVWIGTLSQGLVSYDPRTGRKRFFRHDPADSRSLASNRVRTLLWARDGRLWVGTQGGGLDVFDPATESFRHFPPKPEEPQALANGIVVALAEDRDGRVWIGTRGGLHRLDPTTEVFDRFFHRDGEAGAPSSDEIQALHLDTSGRLWVGTDAGLDLWQNGRFRPAAGDPEDNRENGALAGDSVFCILEDLEGRLWMSTDQGMSRFDPATESFRNFNVSDGLQGSDLQTGGCLANDRGEMFFGALVGFHEFHPRAVTDNPHRPPVVITSFEVFDHRVPFEIAAAYGEPLRLSHKDHTVSFAFAALDTTNTRRNQYSYQLVGQDVVWSEPGPERQVTFRNLVPGNYTFRVRGSNNDGVWNEAGAALSFEIVPPPWRTWWAYSLYGVAGVGLLALFFQIQLGRVRHQAENRRKTQELEQARSLQLAMLPAGPPEIPGLDIAVYMRTATEVGGDYYDFFPQDDGSLLVAVGDATGHGISAGMMVSMTKVALQALEVRTQDKILARLSEILAAIHRGGPRMALSLTRVTRREVRFSAAAMPPALLFRGATTQVEELLLPALPLGGSLDPGYRVESVPFAPGDAVVLISDGLPERRNGDQEVLGYRMVQECLAEHGVGTAHDIQRELVALGDVWGAGRPNDDDVTVVVIKNRPESPPKP